MSDVTPNKIIDNSPLLKFDRIDTRMRARSLSGSVDDALHDEARCVNEEVKVVVLNLEKNFGEVWKHAEQSCVIHSITYDSDHLVVERFNISSSGGLIRQCHHQQRSQNRSTEGGMKFGNRGLNGRGEGLAFKQPQDGHQGRMESASSRSTGSGGSDVLVCGGPVCF